MTKRPGFSSLWLVLLWLSLASPLWAAQFLCPYEVELEATSGIITRVLSINRLIDGLRADLGVSGLVTPWQEEEIAGAGRFDANRGLVTIQDGLASLPRVILPVLSGGAGCEVVPGGFTPVAARAPRRVGDALTYDRGDTTRKTITPRQRQGALSQRIQAAWQWLITPAWAQTLGTFPYSTQLLDDFNRGNETPIAGNWTAPAPVTASAANLASNALQGNGAATAGSAYYDAANYTLNGDAYLTANNNNGTRLFYRYEAGTDEGYNIRLVSSTTAAINRRDTGSEVQLGATFTTTNSAGDLWGIRANGTTLEIWQNTGGGWSQIGTRTDATHAGNAADSRVAVQLNTNTHSLDNLFVSVITAVAGRKGVPLWFTP